MANLDFRFDDYVEQYSKRQLEEIREFAKSHVVPNHVRLEIGSNRGRFIASLATRDRDQHHIGIEIRLKYARLSRKDHEKASIKNVDIICADANLVLPIVFDDDQIEEVFILFPDPWWKKRHNKRRLIQPDFLDLLSAKLSPTGKIWIRTDVGPLADAMRDELIEHPNFEPLKPEEYPVEPFPRSTRERTCVSQSMPINLVYFSHSK